MSAIAASVSALGSLLAVLAVWYAGRQLRHSRHASLISVEESLATARRGWRHSVHEQEKLSSLLKADEGDLKLALEFERLDAEIEDLYEQFLNRLDRICASVLDGVIPEDRAKSDYRGMIDGLVAHDSNLLLKETRHENIRYLYNKWNA